LKEGSYYIKSNTLKKQETRYRHPKAKIISSPKKELLLGGQALMNRQPSSNKIFKKILQI
jgi:hypothetical protein